MRTLEKFAIPEILESNHETWLREYLEDQSNPTRKYRYRHDDIKSRLKEETFSKCIYCESYIGHNTPGDIEHKIPTSGEPTLHYTWSNLTIACTECNRRKNAYYDQEAMFIDPYTDPVEDWLDHDGPVVYWLPPNPHLETCVSILELNSDRRPELILRKTNRLNQAMQLLERIAAESSPILRVVLEEQLKHMCSPAGEFSMCIRAFVMKRGFGQIISQ